MKRLNIPLGTSRTTTRRNRRVVLPMAGVAVLMLVSWIGSGLWFSRDTLSRQIPSGTEAMFRFTPDDGNRDLIEDMLSGIPLISNRSLTVADISGFVEGEFAVFIGENGRSLAIRTNADKIPRRLLDAEGILVTEIGPKQFLLTERLIPTETRRNEKSSFRFAIPSPFERRVGTFFLHTDARLLEGRMSSNRNRLRLTAGSSGIKAAERPMLPPETIAYLSMPSLTNMEAIPHFSDIDPTLPGTLLLAEYENGLGFLYSVTDSGEFAQTAQDIIRYASALHRPGLRPLRLPDDTVAEEILVDPSAVTVEERVISGRTVFRVQSSAGGSLFAMLAEEGQLLLSNREELLRAWFGDRAEEAIPVPCDGTHLAIRADRLMHALSEGAVSYQAHAWNAVVDRFPSIGLKLNRFSTEILLCR